MTKTYRITLMRSGGKEQKQGTAFRQSLPQLKASCFSPFICLVSLWASSKITRSNQPWPQHRLHAHYARPVCCQRHPEFLIHSPWFYIIERGNNGPLVSKCWCSVHAAVLRLVRSPVINGKVFPKFLAHFFLPL